MIVECRRNVRWSRYGGVIVLLLALLLPVWPAQSVGAATITVDSLGDGAAVAAHCMVGHTPGTCRLRDAIAAAAANDTITFAVSGMITLTSGILTLAQSVTIDGTGQAIVVDGGCTASCGTTSAVGGVTVFQVNSGVTVMLTALTIQHGNASVSCTTYVASLCGGGIINYGTLTVRGVTISANSAQAGGGIFNGGTLTVANNSVVSGNAASGGFGRGGGGIWNNTITLTVTDSTISGNTSGFTGGGVTNHAAMTMTNDVFSGNTAVVGGTAIDSEASVSTLTVTNSAFTNNTGGGGAIYFLGATLTVARGTFSGNAAYGVVTGGADTGTVTNSTFSGSGIYNGNGTLTVTNGTVSSSIQAEFGTIALTNTIVNGACSTINGGIITDGGHNLQFGGTTCGATIPNTDPKLGMLADNGGTPPLPDGSHVKTFALLTGSPAIDAGDDTVCNQTGSGKVNMMDERGIHRPQGLHCDIGAYEFQVPIPLPLPSPQPTAPTLQGTPRPLPPTQAPVPTVVATPRPLPPRRP